MDSLFAGDSGRQNRLKIILCWSVCAAGFLIDFYAFYPGFMSPDTIDQFTQAMHNSYGNWHPPTLAALWHLLLKLWAGPQPMLLLQLFFLWMGTGLLMTALIRKSIWSAPVLLLMVLSPFVQNVAGNIWKDLHMALSWYLSLSIMIFYFLSGKRAGKLAASISLLLIIYGTWVRVSGFPGNIPLLYLWIMISPWSARVHKLWQRGLLALLMSGAVLIGEGLFSKHVIRAHDDHIEYKLMTHDMAGLSIRTGELCFPEIIKKWPGFDTSYLFSHYSLVSFDNIWWNPDNKSIIPHPEEKEFPAIKKYWRSVIMKHPWTYLQMKAEGFLYFLKIKDSGTGLMVMYPYIHSNNYGLTLQPTRMYQFMMPKIEKRYDALYMKPWFWVIVNFIFLAALFLPWLRSWRQMLLVIQLSALFYLAIHFFVYPADTEFRYFYWYTLSVATGAVMTLAGLTDAFQHKHKSETVLKP